MGCMSSKLVSRSLSFNEERRYSLRLKSKDNGIPLLEDLITYDGSSDQYLALVCSANEVANRLYSESFNSNTVSKTTAIETIAKGNSIQVENDLKKRSASCHFIPENIALDEFEEEKPDRSFTGLARSRSYHTVEEFDAMVSKMWLYQPPMIKEGGSGERSLLASKSMMSYGYMQCEDRRCNIEGVEELCIEEKEKGTEEGKGEASGNLLEKGFRRKAIAKRLESLRIPSNIEFPAISSLKEWLPETYVTPKFGSYDKQQVVSEDKCGEEDIVFSKELVDDFEQRMRHLQTEEENLLKQIGESSEVRQYQEDQACRGGALHLG